MAPKTNPGRSRGVLQCVPMWTFAQFAVACVAGSAFFLFAHDMDNPTARSLSSVAVGFGASWLVMFLVTWMRFGWKAARGMSMEP